MNQHNWRANTRYMYLENRWERLHIFGKSSFLDLEPPAMVHADAVSFLTSTDDRIQKYSSMFGFSWKNVYFLLKQVPLSHTLFMTLYPFHLWCGYGSVSFQSCVLSHVVIAPVCNSEKLEKMGDVALLRTKVSSPSQIVWV